MNAIRIVRVVLVASACTSLAAQDLGHKAPPQGRAVVIVDAELHVGDGRVLAPASLWFLGGRIKGVAANAAELEAPPDAERIDGRGLVAWPGLIDAASLIGLSEIGSISATQDFDEIGDFSPEANASVAVNPDATTLPVARTNGVLVAGVFPQGGGVAGHASVIQLDGWTSEDLTVRRAAGLVVEWPELPPRDPRGDRRAQDGLRERSLLARAAIDRGFRDARAWLAARDADPGVASDLRFLALAPALRGEVPVLIRARGAEAVRSSLAWALGLGVRSVLVGGDGAESCIPFLAQHAVPVIVTGTLRLPSRDDDPYDAAFALPAALAAAKIPFCIAGDGGHSNVRNLAQHAATAVAFGLDRATAERAITSAAAAILGVGDELGAIERGKRATLFLAKGDPFEIESRVVAAWIDGRRIDLANKQTRLAEKYREKYRQLGLWPAADGSTQEPVRR